MDDRPGSHEAGRTFKLAFVVSHSDAGGVQHLWSNLSEGFHRLGYEATLVSLYPSDNAKQDLAGLRFVHVVDAKPQSLKGFLNLILRLRALLRREKFDWIFTAMPAANILVPGALAFARERGSVVTSHHTPVTTYNSVLNQFDSMVGRTSLVRRVVAVSDAVLASLDGRSASYRQKSTVIHNALPQSVEDRLRSLRKNRLLPSTQPTVIATGRLAAQKNYPVLIRSAARLPGVRFQVVGSGPDEAMLRKLCVQYGVEGRVLFLGQKTREETLQLMADADIFFQPSYFEGHSLALIEAAKLGLPLVVSDVSVQMEGIRSKAGTLCGFAANADDDAAFSKIFATILETPAAYKSAAEKSQTLGEEITFEGMIAQYRNLIVATDV